MRIRKIPDLVRHGSVALTLKVLAAILAFSLNVVVARVAGAEQAGIYFLSVTVITLCATTGRLGLDNAVVRLVASARQDGNWSAIRAIYGLAVRWAGLASLIIGFSVFLLAGPLSESVFQKPGLAAVLKIMAFVVPVMALFMLHGYALQGLGQIWRALVVISVALPALIQTGVLATRGTVATASNVAAWHLSAALVCLGLGVWWWRRTPHHQAVGSDTPVGLDLWRSARTLLGAQILNLVFLWVGQLILGRWNSSADVAVFSAAQRTALLVSFVLIAINSYAAPRFAALHREGNHEGLERLAQSVTYLVAGAAVPIVVLMMAVPDWILGLFGDEFRRGANALRVLAAGQFVSVLTGSVGYLLMMTGREIRLRRNTAWAAAWAVGTGFLLIPYFGIFGAAISTATAVSLANILSWYWVRREVNINTLPFWR